VPWSAFPRIVPRPDGSYSPGVHQVLASAPPIQVHCAPGTLPEFWDRQVIFMANLLGLFFGNDLETEALREQVGPLETYGGRLVPVLGLLFHGDGPNLLVLERPPVAALLDYFREELRLPLPEIAVLPYESYPALTRRECDTDPQLAALLDRLQQHSAPWMRGYVTDEALTRLAAWMGKQTISSLEADRAGNNKLQLHQHLEQCGLPVFDTEFAESPSDVPSCLASLRRRGYKRAAVKAQIGASGIGILRLETHRAEPVPDYLFHEGPCLVQGWLDGQVDGVRLIGSPSVQLFLDDTSVSLYDLTDQILSERSVHEGNASPVPYLIEDEAARAEILHQAEIAGRWLHEQDYRGTTSADFHVIDRGGRREVRMCEVNARVTGATYPAVLARHFLPEGAWLMRNVRFNGSLDGEALLSGLRKAEVLFQGGRSTGVLPINLNTDAEGRVLKGQFLCLGGSTEETWEQLRRARQVLPAKGEFDRD